MGVGNAVRFGIFLAFIAVALAWSPVQEWRTDRAAKQALEQARVQAAAAHAALADEYRSAKASINATAQQAIDRRAWADAIAATASWLSVADGDTKGLHRFAASNAEAEAAAAAGLKNLLEKQARAEQARADQAQAEADAAVARRIGARPKRSGWDSSYYEVQDYIEARAHDPDSVKMAGCTEALETNAGWETECSYRARNAFGGLILSSARFTIRHGKVVATTIK